MVLPEVMAPLAMMGTAPEKSSIVEGRGFEKEVWFSEGPLPGATTEVYYQSSPIT
jgi:hypothetical protein